MAHPKADVVVCTITGEDAPTRFYLFTCRYPGCEGIIPVEFRLSLNNSCDCIFLMKKETGELSDNMAPVCELCPLCSHVNHFQIKDNIREISCSEYEIELKKAYSTRQDMISPEPIFR